jgi:hypothetical protein
LQGSMVVDIDARLPEVFDGWNPAGDNASGLL